MSDDDAVIKDGKAIATQAARDTECTNILTPSSPSSSHIAYGAIRIEFTFMALGQACATAAVMANKKRTSVQLVNIKDLQKRLLSDHQVYQLPE